MPSRALVEHRPWLMLGLILAVAYYFLDGDAFPEVYLAMVKAGSVLALAVYALVRHRSFDARLLAIVLTLGAVGDFAIEFDQVAGAAFFLLAHVVAIGLFLRNRRGQTTPSQKGAAIALIIAVPAIGASLAAPAGQAGPVALYALGLAAMAAAAWTSRFGRYHVGIGALLFVLSDILIFARIGGSLDPDLASWFIWPLYFSAQFLIATGIIQQLRRGVS